MPLSEVRDAIATHYAQHQWEPPLTGYVPRENATRWPDLSDDIHHKLMMDELRTAAKQLEKNKSSKPMGWSNEIIILTIAVEAFRHLTLDSFNLLCGNTIMAFSHYRGALQERS